MIITHVKPDFDCIVAVWLLKRFCGMEDKEIIFKKFGEQVRSNLQEAVFVDIGKGEFDHHQRNNFVSSTTLVLEKFNLQNDSVLKALADITRRIDHGIEDERTEGILNLINIITGLNKLYPHDPHRVMELAFMCLDAIYKKETKAPNLKEEFKQGIKFQTKWGSGIGFNTNNLGLREYCHKKGYIIFVYIQPLTQYRGIAAQGGKGVDFSEIFNKFRNLEPDAEWYLHFTKDLLICGSDKAINKNLSNLKLEKLIEIVKNA